MMVLNDRGPLRAYMSVSGENGEEHFRYDRGEIEVKDALNYLARWISWRRNVEIEPAAELVLIATDAKGYQWMLNKSKFKDDELDELFEGKFLDSGSRLSIYKRKLEVFNPRGMYGESKPIAVITCAMDLSMTLVSLDATMAEAAGLIHELNNQHLLCCGEFYTKAFLADVPFKKPAVAIEKAPEPSLRDKLKNPWKQELTEGQKKNLELARMIGGSRV